MLLSLFSSDNCFLAVVEPHNNTSADGSGNTARSRLTKQPHARVERVPQLSSSPASQRVIALRSRRRSWRDQTTNRPIFTCFLSTLWIL